ncbi:MAG: class I SAM-dependent methyltransferase [Clostridia bacterium]|jgi:ubiquinone/menaquinone biosynthesis C-methylase UbiE|nr:class I SAM-dependent methyltransferase [Clostridia bacterium]MDD4571204.1 class I SAM-dependent methyltransferase [Clostridia bacterium]
MEMNVAEFDKVAKETFAPVYPVIAKQIKQKTKIMEGTCVDLGCGGGYLGLALAQITNLTVHLFDLLPEMQAIAKKNIKEYGLADRVTTILGDVHELPFADRSIDLLISRGSIFFWEDQAKALQEIYRVLAPGGKTFIGGGFGTPELKAKITQKMKQQDNSWNSNIKNRIGKASDEHFCSMLAQAGVTNFTIDRSDAGMWIIMRREAA